MGKDIFHLVGFDAAGSIVLRRKIKRLALARTFEKLPRLKIRAFLIERGITVRTGTNALGNSLFPIFENRKDEISPRMTNLILGLYEDWLGLDERIKGLTNEITKTSRAEENCERLMSVPGIGPMISTAILAAIGTGEAFDRGRDFGAWLGLVPSQYGTGGKPILERISQRGSRYQRTLFIQAAHIILMRPQNWEKFSFGPWLQQATTRMHGNKLATALANKLARIAWSILRNGGLLNLRRPEAAAVCSSNTPTHSRLRSTHGTDQETHSKSVWRKGCHPTGPLMRQQVRAYSHQGHGPRADQTGRIHISDFRSLMHDTHCETQPVHTSLHLASIGVTAERSQ